MNTGVTLQIDSASSEATEELGRKLGSKLRGGEVIELRSDLGGGKTTLVRGLAAGMGSTDAVASPSFTISRVYEGFRNAGAPQFVQPDGMQGAAEQRTEPYTKYGEGAAETVTPQSAGSGGRFAGFAGKQADTGQKLWLHHYDFYRLAEPGLMAQELQEVIADPQNVAVIEWADVVEDVLPEQYIEIYISVTGDTNRALTIKIPSTCEYVQEAFA
jgi:tRNA A37 threonylcarbamoyladenosine biosynthesis protein TsaE